MATSENDITRFGALNAKSKNEQGRVQEGRNTPSMLKTTGKTPGFKLGCLFAREALASGKAYEKFPQFKSQQGHQ